MGMFSHVSAPTATGIRIPPGEINVKGMSAQLGEAGRGLHGGEEAKGARRPKAGEQSGFLDMACAISFHFNKC